MENYNYNYRSLSNIYLEQTNPYPLMDFDSIHRRATDERLGDVGYECPQPSIYQHHEHHDSCYNYRGSRYSPRQENYQSPVVELETYPCGEQDYGISSLRLVEENGVDHSSPVQQTFLPAPSSPAMQLPQSPWTQYSEDEFSRNFENTQYTAYTELQPGSGMNNSHYFQSPRTVEDNITNLGYQPHYSSDLDDVPTAIRNTSGKTHNNQGNNTTVITEEKETPILELPIDQKNKSVDVRSTGLSSAPGRRYRCPVRGCNLQFKRRAEMDRHKESVHQPSPGHLCPIPGCNRGVPDNGFSRKDNLRQHLKLKHEVKFPKGRRSRRT
ncbi:uncharacterized protein LAJ45_08104 [Morchella importuna]|nr:uncharacterized protein LAJ45_08104 [Morchella importuna]KAH8148002.1 hypothetical protein LAJ45_08104 [Morchella importuna]